MHAYWYGPNSTTMCAEETRRMEQIQHHQMHKRSLQRSEGEKNHCSNYSMFDISYTTAGCSVFTAQTAGAVTSVSNLFAASDKPQNVKSSPPPPTIKDTLLSSSGRGEEGGERESFQQLQQQFHLACAACRSQRQHSQVS